MRKAAAHAVRFLLLVAVAVTLSSVLTSLAPERTPYGSALVLPAGSPALAASGCADKTCASFGGPCTKAVGFFCAKSGGQCFTKACQ